MDPMWTDARGSEVLELSECRRLLAVGAKQRLHGHLGIPKEGAPLVLPVNYVVHGPDVVIRIGEAMFKDVSAGALISFQVDGVEDGRLWSVLVRGLAIDEDASSLGPDLPIPEIAEPGHRFVRIRADVVTGRRFTPASPEASKA